MLFISVDDFLQKARDVIRLSRNDEKKLSLEMESASVDDRKAIVNSYLPMVVSYIRCSPKELQTLETIYSCVCSLKKGVDSFNYLQDSETFTHHLSWPLRQYIKRCLVDRQ